MEYLIHNVAYVVGGLSLLGFVASLLAWNDGTAGNRDGLSSMAVCAALLVAAVWVIKLI